MEMITCPACGEENPARFRLCGYCGSPLAPEVPPQEERKVVTVFFSDLKGSTDLGEALDPESLRAVMTRYFDAMTLVLRRHGGTIEKFIGDAIMAVFGLPKIHEDDALRAVRAAHETQAALAELNDELDRTYGVRLTNRTGVNTGEVVAGDSASGQRLVTGDTVNVAARLEQAAPANEILLGELTYRLVRGAVEVEVMEPLELKGKADRVPAYRLLGVSHATEGIERRQDAPMVGREREMASLAGMFRRAVEERACRMVTVLADAGVGKSRLVREFTASLAEDARVVRGRCLPYGEGITFWPLVEAAREAAGIEADDGHETAIGKLAAITGDADVTARLASAIGLASGQFPVAEIFWAARRFLEALAHERPVVVVIDDIHWAEATFLDLITHLGETVEAASVLLLCTSRPDLLEHHPTWARDEASLQIVLQPLTDADASLVVSGLLGRVGIAGDAERRIVRAAEGNPLFVEQLLSMMLDSGALQREDGHWRLAVHVAELDVPPSIQALLAARLDLLARDERAVLEPASVIGLTFAEAAVTELAPDPIRPRVADLLTTLSRKQLLRPQGDLAGEDADYRFGHILIRDAAYNGVLKRARATFHERHADWADEVNRRHGRSQEFEEILGYHLEQAYRYLAELGTVDDHAREVGRRAAEKLASAGRRAMARGDMPAAVNLLRRAAACLPSDALPHLHLLPDLGEALTELGQFEEAAGVLRQAIRGAAAHGDEVLGAQAELVAVLANLYSSDDPGWSARALAAVERAQPVFERHAHHDGLALAARLEAIVHGSAHRFAVATAAAERMVAEAQRAHNIRLERRGAVVYAQSALFGPTPVPDAIARAEDLTAMAAGDRRTEALLRSSLGLLYAMSDDVERARAEYSHARAMLLDLGPGLLAAATSAWLAQIELLAGAPDAAEPDLRRDYEALTRLGEKFLLSSLVGLLARVLVRRGALEEAERLAAEAEALAAADDTDAQALWREVRAEVYSRRGDHARAIALAVDAVELRRRADAPALAGEALAVLGDVRSAAGDVAEAEAAYAEALALFIAKGDVASARRLEARQPTSPGSARSR